MKHTKRKRDTIERKPAFSVYIKSMKMIIVSEYSVISNTFGVSVVLNIVQRNKDKQISVDLIVK